MGGDSEGTTSQWALIKPIKALESRQCDREEKLREEREREGSKKKKREILK